MIQHERTMPAASAPAEQAAAADPALGLLPAWRLADLYPGKDAPALKADIDKATALTKDFEEKWKGRLADAAGKSGPEGIGQALAEFEALEDLLGKIGS